MIPCFQFRKLGGGEGIVPELPPVDNRKTLHLPVLAIFRLCRFGLLQGGLLPIKGKGSVPHPVGSEMRFKMCEIGRGRNLHGIQQFAFQRVALNISLFIQ